MMLEEIEALLSRKRQLEAFAGAFNNDALKWLRDAVELLLKLEQQRKR